MQKCLTAIALTVTLVAPMSGANADEACSKLSDSPPVPNYPHHIRNVMWRNMREKCKTDVALSVQWQSKNYTFKFQVGSQPLTELSLSAPGNVRLENTISVTNQTGEKVAATITVTEQKATIIFAEPVAPGSILTVLKQAKTPKNVQAFEETIAGKTEADASEISLGTVKVQTDIN